MQPIKNALISVSDKRNLEPIATFLKNNGVGIIATGGTRAFLNSIHVDTIDISNITKRPESFDGRVKTLDFSILSGLLFDRDKHSEEAHQLNIAPIDLLICNFYPFHHVTEDNNVETLIRHIDIGGVTMVRAAAKNFHGVTVVTDPSDYTALSEELSHNHMQSRLETRTRLMIKAFNVVADYDAEIATRMSKLQGKSSLRLSYSEHKALRYGENPHQEATVYRDTLAKQGTSITDQVQLHGKDLSFNNVLDLISALDAVSLFSRYACCVIKHNTACGLTEGDNTSDLLPLTWAGDPVSAFGSVIAFNCTVDKADLTFLAFDSPDKQQRKFVEVIAAKGFTDAALAYLKIQPNLRVLSISEAYFEAHRQQSELRFIPGGVLSQSVDNKLVEKVDCVTKVNTLALNIKKELIDFGLKAVKQLKSNAIAIVRECQDGAFQLLGQGSGQPNRLNSVKLAIERAQKNLALLGEPVDLANAVLISEAFFPFADSITECAAGGIKTIIQPGGSIRDCDVISACDAQQIAMYFTGIRHFKH